MYTVDYLKTLHADYVEWNTDPGGTVKSFQVKDPPARSFASMTMDFMTN